MSTRVTISYYESQVKMRTHCNKMNANETIK